MLSIIVLWECGSRKVIGKSSEDFDMISTYKAFFLIDRIKQKCLIYSKWLFQFNLKERVTVL